MAMTNDERQPDEPRAIEYWAKQTFAIAWTRDNVCQILLEKTLLRLNWIRNWPDNSETHICLFFLSLFFPFVMRHKSVSHVINVPLIFEIEISFYNRKRFFQLNFREGRRSRERWAKSIIGLRTSRQLPPKTPKLCQFCTLAMFLENIFLGRFSLKDNDDKRSNEDIGDNDDNDDNRDIDDNEQSKRLATWDLRHWLHFWQLRKSDRGQHSQFLGCFNEQTEQV